MLSFGHLWSKPDTLAGCAIVNSEARLTMIVDRVIRNHSACSIGRPVVPDVMAGWLAFHIDEGYFHSVRPKYAMTKAHPIVPKTHKHYD